MGRQYLGSSHIMKTSAVAAVALLCLAVAEATQASTKQIIPDFLEPGNCPSVNEKALWEVQQPNPEKFSGKWFEYARTNNPYQLIKQCTHSNLTYNGNGFTHLTMGLDESGNLKSRDGVTVAFTSGGNANNPHLSIMMDDPITAAPFVILDTDYDNYACIYSCMDWNNNYLSDFGFIWSRNAEMEASQYEKCKTAFAKHTVDTNRFNRVEQGPKCDYDLIRSHFMPQINMA